MIKPHTLFMYIAILSGMMQIAGWGFMLFAQAGPAWMMLTFAYLFLGFPVVEYLRRGLDDIPPWLQTTTSLAMLIAIPLLVLHSYLAALATMDDYIWTLSEHLRMPSNMGLIYGLALTAFMMLAIAIYLSKKTPTGIAVFLLIATLLQFPVALFNGPELLRNIGGLGIGLFFIIGPFKGLLKKARSTGGS